jgi:glucose/arabinose dehydrogenase
MTAAARRAALGCVLTLAVIACGPTSGTQRPQTSGSIAPTRSFAPPTSVPSGGSATSASIPPAAGPFDASTVAIELEPVADGLESPLGVTNAGDGSGRIFVVEQGGRIRIVRDGRLASEPFLDIGDRISSGGERGLLGLAFHPDYPKDPRLFVDYTDANGDTQVASYTVDPSDPDRADPDSEVRLLSIEQPYPNHNGGAVLFGPDGFLYVSTGDGGSGGDPHGNGQSLGTLLGKILRIDVGSGGGGASAYSVPNDNPFVGRDDARPEIWLYGLRNPWRMSFDRANGDLWIGDVGQGEWEEIDVVRAGTSGQNFGWNRMEGSHCFRPASGCDTTDLVAPIAEYGHDVGCTVIGGNVYRGSDQPRLVGGYVFADYCSGRIWAIAAASDGSTEPVLVAETGATLSSFGEDEEGELFATDLSSGQLLRIRARSN